MNDSSTTPGPVLDFAIWQRQEREHISRAAEVLPANKTNLFDALAAEAITIVIVTFDGCGDSGQIEDIEVKAGEEIVTLPPGNIEIARAVWGICHIDRQTMTIQDGIESLVPGVIQNEG